MNKFIRFNKQVFSLNNLIAKGSYGNIYKSKSLTNYNNYIIKETSCNFSININEIENMKKLKNLEKVVSLKDYTISNDNFYILMKYYEKGDFFSYLEKFIKKDWDYKESIIDDIIYQLLAPIEELHNNNIAHLDIKPENYLIQNIENNSPKLILTDLGSLHKLTNRNLIKDINFKVGSKLYNSPEVNNNKYHLNSDIWNIGIITYMLLFNKKPSQTDINKILYSDNVIISKKWDTFFKNTLNTNAYKRYSVLDIKRFLK